MSPLCKTLVVTLGLGSALVPLAAAAQDKSGAAKHLTLLGIPSATTAPGGSVFGALSYSTNRSGAPDDDDGSLALGVGLGDANDALGVQLTAEITSLSDDFADSGYFALKFSRRISEGQMPLYLAVSASDLAPWGDAEENDASYDLTLTGFQWLNTQSASPTPMMFSLGVGTHVRDARSEPGAYLGAGIGLSETLAASASWYGDYGTLGVSFAPQRTRNFSITASLHDVTNETGDQAGILTLNYIIPKAFGG